MSDIPEDRQAKSCPLRSVVFGIVMNGNMALPVLANVSACFEAMCDIV